MRQAPTASHNHGPTYGATQALDQLYRSLKGAQTTILLEGLPKVGTVFIPLRVRSFLASVSIKARVDEPENVLPPNLRDLRKHVTHLGAFSFPEATE